MCAGLSRHREDMLMQLPRLLFTLSPMPTSKPGDSWEREATPLLPRKGMSAISSPAFRLDTPTL